MVTAMQPQSLLRRFRNFDLTFDSKVFILLVYISNYNTSHKDFMDFVYKSLDLATNSNVSNWTRRIGQTKKIIDTNLSYFNENWNEAEWQHQ